SVDTECRKSLLCMCSQNRCQVYSAGSLCCVQAPYSLDGLGIHIHGLRTVAPAGCNSKGNINAFFAEFVSACCSFADTSDGGVSDNNFNRLAVGVFQILLE